tara:strand:- start:33 stop:164 length:132 start_codon:yes stop_codon:yes gene_type:complete
MHDRDGIDKIKYEANRLWQIINNNKKISIGVIIAAIILFELLT